MFVLEFETTCLCWSYGGASVVKRHLFDHLEHVRPPTHAEKRVREGMQAADTHALKLRKRKM